MIDQTMLQSLEWRLVGPFRGGRVPAVVGHPTEKATFFFGACAGGVWKTTDGGVYWENVSDGFFNTSASGAGGNAPAAPPRQNNGSGGASRSGDGSHGRRG